MSRSIQCAYYQWRISSALDSPEGRARLPVRHLARCPACRQFHQRSAALGDALRQEAVTIVVDSGATGAKHPWVAAPQSEPARVLRTRGTPSGIGRWAWAAGITAAAACVLAVALALAWKGRPGAPSQVVQNPSAHPQVPAPAARYTQEDAARALAAVSDPLGTLRQLARAPIDREIQSVRSEAQAAGRFLASCLPIPAEGDRED